MTHRRISLSAPLLLFLAALSVCVFLPACGRKPDSQTANLPILSRTSTTDPSTNVPRTTPQSGSPTQPGTSSGSRPDTDGTSGSDPMTTSPAPQTSHSQTTPSVQTGQTTPSTSQSNPPQPPATHSKSELVRVKDFIPDIHVDLRYAGSNNVAGRAIYGFSDAYLRYGTVQKLAKVQKALSEQGLSLLIWDAYRPLDAQYALSVILPSYGTNPVSGTTGFNYGGTLSLAIVKADGSAVPLPSDFDADGAKSDRDFSDLSATAAKYGKLLDDLMRQNGFERYLNKWYRYSDSDSYPLVTATTLDGQGIADCEEWITDCPDTVNVRKGPSTSYSILTKLKNGTSVKVAFFHEKFAYVTYGDGNTGYISATYLRRPDDQSYEKDLSSVRVVAKYSYEQMQEDLAEMAARYPDLLRLTSIGKSEEGRELTLAVLGNPDAKKKVFVSAGIHAREYMNATLVMAQIDYMLGHPDARTADGKTVKELLNGVCFHILPMSNPDGIYISQTGIVPDLFKGKYGSATAALWKANAKGIDLNANFDADWERYGGDKAPTEPGYMGYKGTAPECAAESKAIAEYVRKGSFDLVLCYHCTGSVIYWSYGNNTAVNNLNKTLAQRLAMTSGFTLGSPGVNSTAGLKDYVVDKLGIPSLTIEFGASECPMDLREFSNLWGRCRDTLLTCAEWVLER